MKDSKRSWQLIALLWLAFALRVWQLGEQSLWYDEGYSAYLGAHVSVGQALELTVRDIVPPLYYLLLRGWLPLAGTGEYALRFLSVGFGMVAVVLVERIARRLGGERAGLLGAGLAAVAPVLIWLSQDARMYGPLVTWSLLASWGLLRAVAPAATDAARRQGWAIFAVAGLAALYTHTVAVFWLAGQVVFALLNLWRQRRRRQPVRDGMVALGVLALGYVPWVIVAWLSLEQNAGYWPGYLPPSYLWRVAWDTFVGGQHLAPAQTDLAAAWFAGTALAAWLVLLLRRPRAAVYLSCYLVLPLLAMGIAFQHTPKLAPRYPTAMAPALLLVLAAGLTTLFEPSRSPPNTERIPQYAIRNTQYASRLTPHASRITHHVLRTAYFLALAGALFFFVQANVNLYANADYGKDDWRGVADYVRREQAPGETVLLVSGHTYPVFAYYYGWEGWHALPADRQLDITHVLDYGTAAPQLDQMLADAEGVWLVSWQEEVVDPTGLVPALLSEVGQELPVPAFRGRSAGDRVRLRHFKLQERAAFPEALPVQHSIQQRVAPGLVSLGYSLPPQPVPADVEVVVRGFWQATEPLEGAHAASLRLIDRQGQEWARQDRFLAGPWYFSERWPVDTPVMGVYTVTLPAGTPPGIYTPTLQVYRGDDIFDPLVMASLVVTRPLSVPSLESLALPLVTPPQPAARDSGHHEISLVGVGFDQGQATPCQNWALSLAWRAETVPTGDYYLRLSAGPDQAETPLTVDYPTTRWQAGDVWRTRHGVPINCRALDGTVPLIARLLDPRGRTAGASLDLGQVTIAAGRSFQLPQDLTARLDVQLPDIGTLEGYHLEKDRVRPGENLQVTLYWRAGQEIDENYSVFVHLEQDPLGLTCLHLPWRSVPGGGRCQEADSGRGVWAQHDGWPANGAKPTSTWARGEVIADQHDVLIDRNIPPGAYRLVTGMYNVETVQNLAALDATGQPVESGRIVLQPITIYVP
jgi:hypothetical protein